MHINEVNIIHRPYIVVSSFQKQKLYTCYKMASFSMEEFVGNGVLKQLVPKLLEDGWDDVPTLKIMTSDDMNAINMTERQKSALEIRSYLHDRALMQYADSLEASGKTLPEILSLSMADLSSGFGMRRGHIARFVDRNNPCADPPLPTDNQMTSTTSANYRSFKRHTHTYVGSKKLPTISGFSGRSSIKSDQSIELALADLKIQDGHVFKGIVAAGPPQSRCGCMRAPPVVDTVVSRSSIESISVQKLAPEYKIGMERLVKAKAPPMKASELWRDKPAVLLCIRRPGCIMCRAEAHQLYAKKPIFDSMGVQLYAVLHEYIESEVNNFWPRYWGGVVLYDQSMAFFKALGGGRLLKERFIPGFVFNPRAIANYKRARAMGMENNFRGEGEIKGGLFVVGKAKSGVAYQFIERNFGDWAPVAEVIEICSRLQNHQQSQERSTKSLQE